MWNKNACLFVFTCLSADALAPSKYHHQIAKANTIPRIAEEAAWIGQFSWLSIPRMTATTNSPRRMMVNNPKRSGKCAASGGYFELCPGAMNGVARSMIIAIPHKMNRAGGGASAEASQIVAAAPKPMAYRVV